MKPDPITTNRLSLEPLSVDDVDALHGAWSDEAALEHWYLPAPADIEESRRRLESMLAEPTAMFWGIHLPGESGAIGHVGFISSSPGRRCPFGYLIGPRHWGHGYVPEAARAALEAGIAQQRLAGAELWIYAENQRSVRVAEKIGCTLRGQFVAFNVVRRIRRQTLVYGVTATELGLADATPDPVAFYALHPVLAVPNVGRALDFYCGQLGFHLDWSTGDPPVSAAVSRVEWTPQAATIRLRLDPNAPVERSGALSIGVDDVDRLAQELRAAEVEIAEGPVDRPWGLRELEILDPFGHRIQFVTPVI